MTIRRLLAETADMAATYVDGLSNQPSGWSVSVEELRAGLGGPLPELSTDALEVISNLVESVEPGLVSSPGGRYFGFVIGGTTHAALAADWLTSAWDQNAGLYVCGPAAAVVEEIAGAWIPELLGLPPGVSFGFVTGCQMAHVTALAAARYRVLAKVGWDVNEQGLFGAPAVRVFVGAERHVTVDRALRLLGFGAASIVSVDTDAQGRMRPSCLREELVR